LGKREEKRQETSRRIAEAALSLFIEQGYDGTTVEAIAAAAGISRRTFFFYFKSKEEILLAWNMDGFIDELGKAFETHEATAAPFELVRAALPALVARFETRKSIVVDRLMRSTEALRLRKQAWYMRLEERLFETLRSHWPEAHRRPALRLVAMTAIGTMRVSMERWREESGVRPLADYLREDLALLDDHIHKNKRVRRRRIKS
jgi:AcrR family transcriptional regulator